MDEKDLFPNAGELTRACLDDILNNEYAFYNNDDEPTPEYLLEYKFKSFADGLTDTIIKHGFNGNADSVKEKTEYIKHKCKENNVSLNPQIVSNWFVETRPISSESSRENVYRLCFALNMTVEQTINFFVNVYYECPFNFRELKETIYFFCINNGLSYSTALSLNEKAEKLFTDSDKNAPEYEYTTAIGAGLKNIHTEDELLSFISKNSGEFNIRNRTAYKYASQLIDEVCDLAQNECRDQGELTQKVGRAKNIDLFLFVLLGDNVNQYKKDSSFAKAALFPELVKSNFPLKMQLSKIKNGEKVSYDTMRKALIILNFYRYYAELFQNPPYDGFCVLEQDFAEFIAETNDLLSSCGYPVLYVRNPFDWLIMHCGNAEYPLEEFKNAIRRYFLDIV